MSKGNLRTVIMGAFVVLAVTSGLFLFLARTAENTQIQKESIPPVARHQTLPLAENRYRNEKYGFELTLPPSWKKEKTFTKEVTIGGFDSSNDGVDLGYALDKEDERLNDIAYLYNIYIITLAEWSKSDQGILEKLGENNLYVFAFLPKNDLLQNSGYGDFCLEHASEQKEFCAAYTDLKQIVDQPSLEKLHFRTMQANVSAENSYEDSRIGYSFHYPKDWAKNVNDDLTTKIHWTDQEVISQVQVGEPNIPDFSGQFIENFSGLNKPSGAALNLTVGYLAEAVSDAIPQGYVDTGFSVGGARVIKSEGRDYTDFPCLRKVGCLNDPSIVYEQAYDFYLKGRQYHIRGVVSMNKNEIHDKEKRKELIEKSIQEFENVIQSFKLSPQ